MIFSESNTERDLHFEKYFFSHAFIQSLTLIGSKDEFSINDDTENLVRIRAWEYLALHTDILDNDTIVAILKNARSETEANLMLNSLALIKHFKPQTKFDFTKEIFSPEWYDQPNDLVNRRMDYLMEH